MNNENDEITQISGAVTENITPKDLMKFAKMILAVVAVIFILSGISEFIKPYNHVFEACKTILPSITTLVIGFYFGRSS